MKKQLLPLVFAAMGCSFYAKASPGDTTWVQAFNGDSLTHYGNYNKAVRFPASSTSFRKIYMIFTLGEYQCPAGSQYCHQWDYTVTNYLLTPAGDSLEIGRFISPYANTGVPRFPSSWTQRYVYDVTDFYPALKDSATVRINYSGYSWGFTANVKFAFIEGTPERNVLAIKRAWHGSFNYGDTAHPFDSHLQPMTLTAPANTQSAEMHYTVTGHGADASSQCCEFNTGAYPNGHSYQVLVNNNMVAQKAVWRDDCGLNELYPQGGTWIYDRGGWCPGADVVTARHKLTGVTAGSNYTLDVNFDPYTNVPVSGNTGFGSYSMEAQVFYYGSMNHTLDASLEDVIAPTNHERYFRENPSASAPVIKIRNTGSSAINSISFAYGVKDSAKKQYTWNGILPSLRDTIITLPALQTITNMSLAGVNGVYNFIANITAVNGIADNDPTNDTIRSSFVVAPTWPAVFVVSMKTNSEGTNGIGSGNSETSWVITDMNNNIVASRTNAALSTLYNDTVKIGPAGFYRLSVTDGGCDGLHWWVWDSNPSYGVTAGNFIIKKPGTTASIPLNGNTYSGTYHDDFGCGFTQYFTTAGNWPLEVNSITHISAAMLEAYPNPARNVITVRLKGMQEAHGTLQVFDAPGRCVLNRPCNDTELSLDVTALNSGVYTLLFTDERSNKLQTRILIVK